MSLPSPSTSWSAGFTWYELSNWATSAAGRCRHNRLYWTGAGDIDQAHDRMAKLEADVKAKGIPTSYKEIPGRHYWFLWRDFLGDYASLIFK